MQEPNNIDLKDVNKTKKSLRLPKLGNPFKKQDGIKRDAEGKFATTSGSGGLSVAKSINWKRAAPLILIITLLGGMLVFRSFAGGSQQTVASWYRTCLNREPDSGGLAYWSGRLDKGELPMKVAGSFIAAGGVSSCPFPDAPKTVNATPPPKAPAAIAKPKTQTSATSSSFLTDAKAWVTLSSAHVANAKKENATTYRVSSKNPVSKQDLELISAKNGYVRSAITQLQGGVGKVSSLYNQAISNSVTKSQGTEILIQLKLLQINIQSLNNYLVNISNDYKRAESTYQANLSFFSKVADRQRKESDCTAGGGSFNPWSNVCTYPQPTLDTGSDSGSGPAQPRVPAGISKEDQQQFAKKYCESQPNYTKSKPIYGGIQYELRDIYYTSGHTSCNNRFIRVVSISCNNGYQRSGSGCVREAKQAVAQSLPSLPWPVCRDGAESQCVKSKLAWNGKSGGGYDYSIGSNNNYLSKVEVCKLKINRFGFGMKYHSYSNCSIKTGKWKS